MATTPPTPASTTILPPPPAPPTVAEYPCPLRPGRHIWIWPGGKGEGWRTARWQAQRAVSLGADGVICQASLYSPGWLAAADPNELDAAGKPMPRYKVFQSFGLQVTAGLGLDAASSTAKAIVAAVLAALALPGVMVCADWESEVKWESDAGRALAKEICDGVLAVHPDAYLRCIDCPWWEPQYHSRAPTTVFFSLFKHRFVQAYGAPAAGNPVEDTEWMLAQARAHYPQFGVPAAFVHAAEQMYGHSLVNSCRLVLSDEPVIALWDVEEVDSFFRTALLARVFLIKNNYPPTHDGVRAFQAKAGLKADGDVGPITAHAMGLM